MESTSSTALGTLSLEVVLSRVGFVVSSKQLDEVQKTLDNHFGREVKVPEVERWYCEIRNIFQLLGFSSGRVPWWVHQLVATMDEFLLPSDTARKDWVASEVLLVSSLHLSKANLGDLSGLLPGGRGRGKVWLVRSMRAGERVCSIFDEVEFDEQAKFAMYEVVMNAIGVEIPLSAFESNVLRFLIVAPSQLHLEGWAWIRFLHNLADYKGTSAVLCIFSSC